jgi:hypothetical protein
MIEKQIVYSATFRDNISQFCYLRQGAPPIGSTLLIETRNANGQPVRQFWLWPMTPAWLDGIEAPLPTPPCRLVLPTIRLNEPAIEWSPKNAPTPLAHHPERLAAKWRDWYESGAPQVKFYKPPSRWQRFIKYPFKRKHNE